jgi:hypothetical protein
MRFPPFQRAPVTVPLVLAALCLLAVSHRASAQSTDISYPAPVYSNEIAARIAPRDVGDSRRTRHFYIFKGNEGDLVVTVESADLNGDVDVFVARTLRPLLKVTLFGGSSTKATKSFYLRKQETLILRVEGRAVSDSDASYRIVLGGSFAPASPDLARTDEAAPTSGERTPRPGTRRVTATGARIAEPEPVVAEAQPTPTPVETSADVATSEEKPVPTPTPPRTRRNSRARNRPSPAGRPDADSASTNSSADTRSAETSTGDSAKPAGVPARDAASTTEPPATASRRRPPARNARRRTPSPPSGGLGETAAGAPEPSATAPVPPAPVVTILRFVVLTKTGERREHDMSLVRRVIVENNQLVVVLKDGRIIRTPLALVEKMSFEP